MGRAAGIRTAGHGPQDAAAGRGSQDAAAGEPRAAARAVRAQKP